jgi:hypothetical protein
MVYTNGVHCSVLTLSHTFGSPIGTISETGFKEMIVTLPANTRIELYASSTGTGTITLNNTCLNVGGAN